MLGDKIKSLRLEKGLSQSELARRLSVVRQTVSKWENGLSAPDSEMLINIAAVLETSVSDLIGENTGLAAVHETEEPNKEVLGEKRSSGKVLSTTLIILGFPVWFSLAVAGFAVIFSLLISLWAVIISLWAVFVAFLVSSFGGTVAGVVFIFSGNAPSGFAALGASLVLAGISIFLFFLCKSATKYAVVLTKKIISFIASLFAKKGVKDD